MPILRKTKANKVKELKKKELKRIILEASLILKPQSIKERRAMVNREKPKIRAKILAAIFLSSLPIS